MNPKDSLGSEPCEALPFVQEPKQDREQISVKRVRTIIEALLFVSDEPLTLDKMQTVLEGYARKELQELLEGLIGEYREREGALEILEVASGYQVRTRPEFSTWIRKLKRQKPARLTRSSMETLAIIAYKQPLTRAEIEHIRGVDSMGVLGSLLEKQLIRILGRKELPGRPLLYGTTQEFLEVFGLKNLKSMPTLKEIEGMLVEGAPEREVRGEDGEERALVTSAEPAELSFPSDAGRVAEGEGATALDFPLAQEETDESLADETISTEEMDDILKSARRRYLSAKRHLAIEEEDATKEPDGKEATSVTSAEGSK